MPFTLVDTRFYEGSLSRSLYIGLRQIKDMFNGYTRPDF